MKSVNVFILAWKWEDLVSNNKGGQYYVLYHFKKFMPEVSSSSFENLNDKEVMLIKVNEVSIGKVQEYLWDG